MESLFLKVLNMSITASYVILTLLFIRLLLKRVPKKYSYLLWSVVLFRLICPVSFSSVFSIFQTKPFDMTTAQRGGGAALHYVPADIGYMSTPKVTVGIPTMNSIISESLPAAAPYASVNPLQIWILLGTILWCTGITVLLVYNTITYIRLKRRMATAVRLESNVYESDKIRSPFILGFIRPQIYIPFGLGEQERAYILHHERYHLKRKDHLIKPLSFCVLAVHWFNPFVWFAYILMTKDMEMSCDERVLSEADDDIIYEYSTSLLSFAANRRFLAAKPLTFGEIGIRERVKNVLRFRKPKKWVIVLAVILCFATVAVCAANPMQNTEGKRSAELNGNYAFEKQIYMNPLSSFIAFDGYREYYTITENSLILIDEAGNQQRIPVTYTQNEVDERAFWNDFMVENMGVPDISAYKERYQYTLTDASGAAVYRIYRLDDEIWLARLHRDNVNTQKSRYIWSIYKIKKFDGEIPIKTSVYGTQDGVEDFLSLQGDFKSGYDTDTCYNITPVTIKENSDYRIFKYDTSCASFLLYEGNIYPLGEWFGGFGVTSMALADMEGDGVPELYFTYSWGSGLHRSHAAYFNPAAKQIVTFAYTHPNGDMMITSNNDGRLSLYAGLLSRMKNFVNFDIESTDFISDIVYRNHEILLGQ